MKYLVTGAARFIDFMWRTGSVATAIRVVG